MLFFVDTEILKEILSTVKDIHQLLKRAFPEPDTVRETLNKLPEESQTIENEETEDKGTEENHELKSDDNTEIVVYENVDENTVESPMEYSNVEYIDPEQEYQMIEEIQFPIKTLSDLEWLNKEMSKSSSPYRHKIVSSFKIFQKKSEKSVKKSFFLGGINESKGHP